MPLIHSFSIDQKATTATAKVKRQIATTIRMISKLRASRATKKLVINPAKTKKTLAIQLSIIMLRFLSASMKYPSLNFENNSSNYSHLIKTKQMRLVYNSKN